MTRQTIEPRRPSAALFAGNESRLAILSAVAAVIVLGACAKDITGDFERFADRTCACTDAACARTVLDQFAAFAKQQGQVRGDETRTTAAAERLAKCAVKVGMSPEELMRVVDELAR